ncbi:MAG: 16S rRNA (cytosine(1402)-N(4))-methyltransferase RsmH [Vicinamibacteria bacterium]|jgi:16S rRNA (cytosine1402-N4)-methyltransferase|nr:16S rRNA (cytosine(1402)-N(4))-methyltransferase RsmH [Vicinamibacteria bacterium]
MASDVEGRHHSVLLAETMELLAVEPGGLYVDGTVGLGGHAAAILDRSAPDGRLIGIDRDPETLELARERLAGYGTRVSLHHGDYKDLPRWLGTQRPRAILLDLGVNSVQLTAPSRGFSFRHEGPLDMRFDQSRGFTAADYIQRLPEQELADAIFAWGEEPAARKIARAIVYARRAQPIATTFELAEIVRRTVKTRRHERIDPATRTFQALRILVNAELDGLARVIETLANCLAAGGRLAIIAFHSLEDRPVKQTFRALARVDFEELTRKPVRPGPAECGANPRARSARLRVLRRVEECA